MRRSRLIQVKQKSEVEDRKNMVFFFFLVFGAIPGGDQGLLLGLHSGITPGRVAGESNQGLPYARQKPYTLYY